ncbi:phage holin family protein [Nocardioides houyundeii]|uniref:phage holin family protein n=1 Tax=Nocardioides houyundeii TaxID=2045452 RepID=UPI0013B462E0|nr:phage holin family protein [Nocardioides houyundeii]
MASEARSAPRARITAADLGRLLFGWLVSTLTLALADALESDFAADSVWSLLAVSAISGVIGLVVRPILVEVTVRVGWLLVVPVAFVSQAVVMHAAMMTVPGITATFQAAFVASWISAAGGTLVAYAVSAGTDESLTTALARRSRAVAIPDPEVDGVVIVQLDGVPFPVLRWAVQAGGLPTIRRWVTSGDYRLREWTAQLPCTTPASQLGILHGTVAGVPGFRWYDRELGRVLVANHPADARIIEERASNGEGLLCEDGVSISNLFSGDAPNALLTMSTASQSRGSRQTKRALAWFMLTPTGFARSLTRTVGEVVKERWQARRQKRLRLEPRVPRSWTFALLRAVTNALLRDLNTALIAEEMLRGTKVIYADYVDYDEIAHHAGIFRHESLASLEGLDRMLAQLELLAAQASRGYRIVVLSDHGQSQGQPFADRYGTDLSAVCAQLIVEDVHAYQSDEEGWGRARTLVQDMGDEGVSGRLAAPAQERLDRELQDTAGSPDHLVVLGSGNLGLLYVPGDVRVSTDGLARRWPGLLPGLCQHPGVGFVAGIDDEGVAWAYGRHGRCNLVTGAVAGDDPLQGFGEHARRVLARTVLRPEAPDLYVNSSLDPDTLEVAAFEELVGAHGGLGGWQDRGVLLAPCDLVESAPERIEGADELHQVLLGFLRLSGQRRGSGAAVGVQRPGPAGHQPDHPALGGQVGDR